MRGICEDSSACERVEDELVPVWGDLTELMEEQEWEEVHSLIDGVHSSTLRRKGTHMLQRMKRRREVSESGDG